MKRIFVYLGLISFFLTNASLVEPSAEKNIECYPVTFFETLENAVAKFKELDKNQTNPILLPT
ncbi:hypothetical protein [Thalassobacillus sp. CUG 92003]|uniref:hypothetical protein n=1 Tax=Thalassobacillus sp. CUG 92003 TaxID=2736641 RepID=UPI0015E794DA|nr:hypothetical protein [Thalassobacillus sp. CUG 92003]